MSDIGSRGIRSDRAIEGHLQYAQNWVALKANLRLVAWGGILIVSMRTTKMGKMMAVVAVVVVVGSGRWELDKPMGARGLGSPRSAWILAPLPQE